MAGPVLLLHGLGRLARSMRPLARRLKREGFRPRLLDYPSRQYPIAELVERFVRPEIEALADGGPVHAVTHSLGGLLVRASAERHGLPDGSRVVMIAPPNQGSEVADHMAGLAPLRRWLGPALEELGTAPECVPATLGACDFELGVIAGDRRLYPFFSPLFSGDHDGLVSVERARLDSADDFVTVHAGHAFIMRSPATIAETVHFLHHGRFRNGERR